jgi:hypothetical protein
MLNYAVNLAPRAKNKAGQGELMPDWVNGKCYELFLDTLKQFTKLVQYCRIISPPGEV